MNINNDTYCGHIVIIGNSNVGKSSLLNKILGVKISITSNKSGTTQKNILGVHTVQNHQLIYIDTPGITTRSIEHFNEKLFQKYKNITLIIFMVNKNKWSSIEERILNQIKNTLIPIILLINKIDQIKDKTILLPFIKKISLKHKFINLIPISVKTGENLHELCNIIKYHIPKSQYIFSKKHITNVTHNFMISELIREKFIRFLNQEMPYTIRVVTNSVKIDNQHQYKIDISIFVKNKRQKGIIIGKNGEKIKLCYKLSKQDIEKYLQKKIRLFFKIKTNNK